MAYEVEYRSYKDMVTEVADLDNDSFMKAIKENIGKVNSNMRCYRRDNEDEINQRGDCIRSGVRQLKDYFPSPAYIREHMIARVVPKLLSIKRWGIVTPTILGRAYVPVPRTAFDAIVEYSGYAPMSTSYTNFSYCFDYSWAQNNPSRIVNIGSIPKEETGNALHEMAQSIYLRRGVIQRVVRGTRPAPRANSFKKFNPKSYYSPIILPATGDTPYRKNDPVPFIYNDETATRAYRFYVGDRDIEETHFLTVEIYDAICRYIKLNKDTREAILVAMKAYGLQRDPETMGVLNKGELKSVMKDVVSTYRESTRKYFDRAALAHNGYVSAAKKASDAYDKYKGTMVETVFHYPDRLRELIVSLNPSGFDYDAMNWNVFHSFLKSIVDENDLLDYSFPLHSATVAKTNYLKWHWVYAINKTCLEIAEEELRALDK